MTELMTIITNSKRYCNFTILDDINPFNILFRNKDIEIVQVHSAEIIDYKDGEKDIVGFCGVFKWEDNKIISLDGDCYNENMEVIGYSWFRNKNNIKCLDILVGDDW